MTLVPTLTFEQARARVLELVRCAVDSEAVALAEAEGRVLAEAIRADRDYPPLPRSARDGYAVRSADLPGTLRVAGEIPAGSHFTGELQRGEAIEIMTGAPLPAGADAVIMVEHTRVAGDTVTSDRAVTPGENFTAAGAECRQGDMQLEPGARIGSSEIALLATFGVTSVRVYRRPRVAVLSTGDELVGADEHPAPWQIRNSNAHALAAQISRAGGCPEVLPVARDNADSTAPLIERGLHSDLLLLSGGVSAGKYDIVERVLAGMGAEFFFDRVLIQPGQPLVFGRARGTWLFGLPGNPASTMVTFELFARAALERIGGQADSGLPITAAQLTAPLRQRPGLTRFLPARLSADVPLVTPIRWAGSADIPALCRANAFTMSEPDREEYARGDWIRVMIKR